LFAKIVHSTSAVGEPLGFTPESDEEALRDPDDEDPEVPPWFGQPVTKTKVAQESAMSLKI
jgi:hypothetical protein